MERKILTRGAEATIFKVKNKVIKNRTPKKYRLPELDNKIRRRRTKSEIKLITKSSSIIPTPKILENNSKQKNQFSIEMQYIPGKKLSEHLDKIQNKELIKVCEQIGRNIALLHNKGLIHGDLTTSNMILSSKDKQVYFIDFGLGFHSDKIEDKAVDLHLISQALEAKHSKIFEKAFKTILKKYKSKSNQSQEVLKRLEKVEKRGRYKTQYLS